MINLNYPVEARDADDSLIWANPEKKELPTVGSMLKYCVGGAHQSDQQQGFKQKSERGLFVRRLREALAGDGLMEISQGEKEMARQRIGLFFMQPELVLAISEALDKNFAREEAAEKPRAVEAAAVEKEAP